MENVNVNWVTLDSMINAPDVLMTANSAVKLKLAYANRIKFMMLLLTYANKNTSKKLKKKPLINMMLVQHMNQNLIILIILIMIMAIVEIIKYTHMEDVYANKVSLNMMDIIVLETAPIMDIGKFLQIHVFVTLA